MAPHPRPRFSRCRCSCRWGGPLCCRGAVGGGGADGCLPALRSQRWLDKSTPLVLYRWIALLLVVLIYAVRVYLLQG